jgi:hypothetical protein
MSVGQVCSLGASLTVSGGLLQLSLILLLGTYVGRRELLPTHLRWHTACLSPKKIVSKNAQPQ